MNLLLTSAGIFNQSIHQTLVDLLGKPISECKCVMHPDCDLPISRWRCRSLSMYYWNRQSPLAELGWKSLGVLELTALPSVPKENWTADVQETDALLVWGGDVLYLRRWMRESGLAELFDSLKRELVYVGVSAGSMVTGSTIGETYTGSEPPKADDITSEVIVVDHTRWRINRELRGGPGAEAV